MAASAVPSGANSFPSGSNGKTTVAPPKVSSAEATSREQLEDKLPLHEDIMQLARLGEVGPIQKLIEDGKFSAGYTDDEGISPLHVCYQETVFRWTQGGKGLIFEPAVGSDQQSLCALQVLD